MTVWAGYYVRDPVQPPPPALTEQIVRALSRKPNDAIRIARFDRAAIAHLETGAYDTPSVRLNAESVTVVAGEPFLRTEASERGKGREADIDRLHESWRGGDFTMAATSAGTFAAVHHNRSRGELSLVSDKIGVRPIYFAVTDSLVVFANALRILESLPYLKKVIDLRGAIETMALGYPLADRTLYQDIFAIRDAEVVTFRDSSVRRSHYWRITQVPEERAPLDEMAERVYRAFSTAIDRRSGSDRRSVAFLSGGLDSRCMVAELLERGIELHTFNFANEGTKDQILGDAFARAAGTIHSRTPRPPDPVRWSMTMASVWGASPERLARPVERPGMVWSGDGGSVGMGYVGVYPSVIALLRSGRRDDAVEKYFAEHEISLPTRVFRRTLARDLRQLLHDGTREAFDEVRTASEPGREHYFFRMLHDQRRHLMLHFEDVDLHRLEFHLPFYDADLIEAVAAAPADHGVGHRLYNAALRFFPAVINAVAWQTYPGHEPCPIPLPAEAIDQWGNRQKDLVRRDRRASILSDTARLVRSEQFPAPLLDRRYIVAAGLLHWAGVGDYSYAVDYAKTFADLWRVSEGRWSLATGDRSAAASSGA